MYPTGIRSLLSPLPNILFETPGGVLYADPTVDELNALTYYEVYPKTIEDEFFLAAPELAYFRDHCLVPFTGGSFMQAIFRYAPMIGGFYAPGTSFNITKRNTIAALQFDTRYLYVSIPEYKEEIQVENKGEYAVASLLEADMQNGVDTINAIVAVALAQSGQGSRSLAINGWAEAINDGVTPSWDGTVYPTYGNQARNGAVGSTLNSVPLWCGDALGNPGIIQYSQIEEAYQDASVGKKEPNLIVGNKAVIAYVKEKMVAQQRFAQEKDPVWGVTGFRINNAMVLKNDYSPSLKYGKTDPVLGSWLTSTFNTTGMSPATASGLPANTVCTVGEVLVMYNTFDWLFRVTDNEEYGFGFSGFVPAQDNTRVVAQIKAMCNLECLSPRTQKQLYGING